ncbi:hypothetical protein PFISCL1PPCAC_4656 [Pristionchus fissidentatus]|uniref:Transmembrane protein n=1 Tax=Pristionchus fissidentatus TaxID=1538716 RepID=A0AAV5V661_9BILA|nr:hypothetical protein PFISCL1PPCAC_4656 [Pristionchus fissidentatus]
MPSCHCRPLLSLFVTCTNIREVAAKFGSNFDESEQTLMILAFFGVLMVILPCIIICRRIQENDGNDNPVARTRHEVPMRSLVIVANQQVDQYPKQQRVPVARPQLPPSNQTDIGGANYEWKMDGAVGDRPPSAPLLEDDNTEPKS